MDEKTKMCVEKVLELQLALADMIEEVAIETKAGPMTIGRIRGLKDRIDRIRGIVSKPTRS